MTEQISSQSDPPNKSRRDFLGFLAAGPWDESSLRDIREDSLCRQVGYYLDRDDMVTQTMSTFASATVHCARCHDHKFDAISQADYYRTAAIFAGSEDREIPIVSQMGIYEYTRYVEGVRREGSGFKRHTPSGHGSGVPVPVQPEES